MSSAGQAYMAGDAGVCPTSAHYTVMSSTLPGVGGLANLMPTATFAACIWFLRNSWMRRAAPSLVSGTGEGEGRGPAQIAARWS